MKTNLKILTVFVAVVLLLGLSGVVAHAGGLVDTTFNPSNFDTNSASDTYCANIANPYWTLPAPTTFVCYTMPKVGDGCEINYVWVKDLDEDELVRIEYLPTQEIQDWVYADDNCDRQIDTNDHGDLVLLENTLDWYAQDIDGNLWYMGEHTEEYSCTPPKQNCTSLEGTWSANIQEGSLPGIIMLINPSNGDFYQQEYDADNAEDMAKVLRVNARVELTFDNPLALAQKELQDEYEDCLKTKEWSPLELGNVEHKYYCQTTTQGGDPIGLFLLGNELQGGTARTELVDYYLSNPGVGVPVPGFQFDTSP